MKTIMVFLLLTLSAGLFARGNDTTSTAFTGNLAMDSRIASENYVSSMAPSIMAVQESKKSPFLAGLMSLVLPGSGEFYAKSYIKSAVFLALEAAAITVNVISNKKGDEETEKFKKYADENWSVARYAKWLNQYVGVLEPGVTDQVAIDWTGDKKDWERVNFSELNALEEKISHFSHRLPGYGEQQYYELIGKYYQYNHGWADSDPNTSEYMNNITPMFRDYAKMHIKPDQTFYKTASIAATVIVVNHIASAIDAFWTTHRYNKRVDLSMEIRSANYAGTLDFYPELNLKFSF